MNKYIIGVGILAIILILVSYGLSKTETQDTAGKNTAEGVELGISVTDNSYDFGDIDIFGGKVQTTYTLRNDGTEDISILSAVTSCMCTEGEIGGLIFGMHGSSGKTVRISAGEEKILTAFFDPLAHGPNGTGKIKRDLVLKTDSMVTPEIKVTFSANVIKNDDEKL